MSRKHKSHGASLFNKTVPFDAATVELPVELRTSAFLRAWFAWCDYRARNRRKVSKEACTVQLNKLAKYGPEIAIEAIQQAIANDYQGLFPETVRIAGKIGPPRFSGIKAWAEQNRESLHQEYGT